MEKVFKLISSYSTEDTLDGLKRLTSEESDTFYSFESDPNANFFAFDGNVCHWESGDLMLAVLFCDEERIADLIRIDSKIHEGAKGYTKVEDITEDVLYSVHETSIYGFAESNLVHDFHVYREKYLTKDDVLDKINKHGIEKLNENDKLLLQDQVMKHPIES
jgi:hypothetical protein